MGLAHGKCPHCGNPIRVRQSSDGHLRRCEWCGRKFKVNVRNRVGSGKAILFVLLALVAAAIYCVAHSPSVSSRPRATSAPPPSAKSVGSIDHTKASDNASSLAPAAIPVKPIPRQSSPSESTDQQVARLTQARAKALQDLARAKVDARSNFGTLPQHRAEAQQVAKLLAELNVARASGTPEEKLAASSAWNNARLAYEGKSSAAVDRDQNVIDAQQIFSDLNDELKDVASQQKR